MKKIVSFLTFVLLATIVGNLFASVLDVSPFYTVPGLLGLGTIPLQTGLIMFNFANLTWGDNEKNMGGLQVTWYFAPIVDVDNFPELPADPATTEEEVTLESVTGFTFLITKCFLSGYATRETSEVVDEPQGEDDCQSFIHKAEIFFPGTKVEALAFAANVNNANMVFIFLESDGQRRVIGSKAHPAKCKVSVTTGKKTGDRKGMTLEISSYGYTPAPLYTGTIPLTPAA